MLTVTFSKTHCCIPTQSLAGSQRGFRLFKISTQDFIENITYSGMFHPEYCIKKYWLIYSARPYRQNNKNCFVIWVQWAFNNDVQVGKTSRMKTAQNPASCFCRIKNRLIEAKCFFTKARHWACSLFLLIFHLCVFFFPIPSDFAMWVKFCSLFCQFIGDQDWADYIMSPALCFGHCRCLLVWGQKTAQ